MTAPTPARGVTVTFTPVFGDRFLFVQRQLDDPVLGGYWCFPGGKVHVGETLATAMERECLEETGLQSTGRAFFVDSYLLDDRVGAHFALEVASDVVQLNELQNHAWVRTSAELKKFSPRIAGIENHLQYIFEHLALLRGIPKTLQHAVWRPLTQYDLVEERFINR